MARYNVRDLLGHWVKPKSAGGKMCPHACCKGKRVHPANFPVILPRELLRKASERDLMKHYQRMGADDPTHDRARRQIEAEIDRREQAERRRAASAERAKDRRSIAAADREVAYHARFRQAEDATKGYMVTATGRARGITERQVLTRKDVARRYGSDELLAFLGIDRGAGRRSSAAPRITDAESYLNPNHRLNRRLEARRRKAG